MKDTIISAIIALVVGVIFSPYLEVIKGSLISQGDTEIHATQVYYIYYFVVFLLLTIIIYFVLKLIKRILNRIDI